MSSDRFIKVPAKPKQTPVGSSETDAAETARKAEKQAKQEESQARLKRIYVSLFVGSLFVYLNWFKNPFNK